MRKQTSFLPGRLIGLHGKAGCGKSTVALHLVAKGYQVASFAEPIRRMLVSLGVEQKNFTPSHKNSPLPQFGGKSARYLMQTLGTEWGRMMVKDTLWLDTMYHSFAFQSFLKGGDLVIDDLRFYNELEFLAGHKAITIKILRPKLGDNEEPALMEHSSEAGIPDERFDYFLVNDTTKESLVQRVDGFLSAFKK